MADQEQSPAGPLSPEERVAIDGDIATAMCFTGSPHAEDEIIARLGEKLRRCLAAHVALVTERDRMAVRAEQAEGNVAGLQDAIDSLRAERDAAVKRAEAAVADCDAMIRAVNRFDEAAADAMTRAGLTIINQPGATTRQAIEVLGHMIAERDAAIARAQQAELVRDQNAKALSQAVQDLEDARGANYRLRAQLQAEAAARVRVEGEAAKLRAGLAEAVKLCSDCIGGKVMLGTVYEKPCPRCGPLRAMVEGGNQ
jgi:hypothetical protein